MLGRSREEQNQQDFADLRAEVDQLGTDLRELTDTLRRLGARNIAPIRERTRASADKMRKKLRDALTEPPANPGRMASFAFSAGFLIGLFLRPRSPGQTTSEE
jgi:hypothetical protein